MLETEEEIKAELEIVCTAITHIMLTGQKYETGSGASKRVFENAALSELRSYRVELENKLKGTQGQSGMLLGF